MTRTDPYSNQLTMRSISPALRTNGAVNGTGVDRAGVAPNAGRMFQAAVVLIVSGTITDGTHTVEVQDSDDGVTFAPVADAYLQGVEPVIAAADDDKVWEIGYLGRRQFLRTVVTAAGTTTGGIVGTYIVLSDPRVSPVVHP
jgi:hypothetical protein